MAQESKLKPFTRLSTREAFSCPWYGVQHDRSVLPDGREGDYFVVSTPGAAMIIPRLPDGRLLLTEQFRYITQDLSVEFPCGGLNKDETFEQAAVRECKEECGASGPMEYIGDFIPLNGISNDVCQVFIMDVENEELQKLDENEEISVLRLTEQEFEDMISSRQIRDGMTLAAWQLYTTRNKNR